MHKARCWRAAHLVRTAGLLQLRDWGLAQACAPAQDGLWAPLSSPSPPPPAERGQVHGPTWPAGVSEDQAASETGADSMRPGQAAATAPLGCLHTQGSTGLSSPLGSSLDPELRLAEEVALGTLGRGTKSGRS